MQWPCTVISSQFISSHNAKAAAAQTHAAADSPLAQDPAAASRHDDASCACPAARVPLAQVCVVLCPAAMQLLETGHAAVTGRIVQLRQAGPPEPCMRFPSILPPLTHRTHRAIVCHRFFLNVTTHVSNSRPVRRRRQQRRTISDGCSFVLSILYRHHLCLLTGEWTGQQPRCHRASQWTAR